MAVALLGILSLVSLALAAGPAFPAGAIPLATFDGTKATTGDWIVMNDPVMGGRSTSTFVIDHNSQTMVWTGICEVVPSLAAPGVRALSPFLASPVARRLTTAAGSFATSRRGCRCATRFRAQWARRTCCWR